MKKRILILVMLCSLLAASVALASSPYDLDRQFVRDVQNSVDVRMNWKRSVDQTGKFVTITETASVDGGKIEFTVIGYTDRAYQLCLTVPFHKLTMNRNAIFSNTLQIYNCACYIALEEFPKNREPSEIFSAYDIQSAVKEGAPYSSWYLSDGWEWLNRESGYLRIRRSASGTVYTVEAHLLNNGQMWFNCHF